MIDHQPYIDLLHEDNMNNTKNEAIATIDEILDLIENSDDSLRFSPDYIYNVLSRIKKEVK